MAVDYRGITIEIDGDSSKLSEALADIREQSKYVYTGLKEVNSSLRFDTDNITLLSQKQEYLAQAIKSSEDKVKAYRAGLEALSKTAGENGELTAKEQAQYDQLQRSILNTERSIDGYRQQLDELKRAEGEHAESLSSFADSMGTLSERLQASGESIKSVGDAATVALTVPIVGAGKAAIDAALGIDTAFHDLTKTAEGTEAELQALKEGAIALSETQPVSASEIMQIEAMGAQLGYANQNLESFADTVSGLSVATDMGTEQAAMNLAQFSNIMGTAQEDAERYGSTVVDLGNHFSTVESKISDMSMRIAAAGNQIGLSESDVLGLATAISSVGVEAESGGTAISTILSTIDKDVATGSERVEQWAAVAGTSAQQFADAWGKSPIEALEMLLSGFQRSTSAGENMSVMLEELGVKNVRQTDLMKRLAGASDILESAVRTANSAWEQNSALAAEVANRNDSLASKMEVLKNRAQNMLAEVGEPVAAALLGILDAAEPLFDAIESGAQAFADMDEGAQRLIVTAAAIVAAFGPVASVYGRFLEVASGAVGTLGAASEAMQLFRMGMADGLGVMGSLSVATEGLGAVFATSLAGVGIAAAVAAIGGLMTLMADLKQHEQDVADATGGLTSAMGEAATAAADYSAGVEGASRSTESLHDRIEDAIEAQAELARTMHDEWAQIGSDSAALDAYVSQIDELSRKSSLTAEDMAVLNNAIEQVNAMTGASIPTIGSQSDALALNAKQVAEVAEAWERQQGKAQSIEDYNRALEKQRAAQQLLDEAKQRDADITSAQDAEMQRYVGTLANASGTSTQLTGDVATLEAALAEATAEVEQAKSAMAGTDYVFSTFEAAAVAAGLTEKDFAALTEEQMRIVRQSFDGTAKSVTEAVDKIRAAMGAASSMGSYTTTSGGSASSAASDEAIKAQQRANEQRLREQQRANQHEAQALSKALDAEYKERQKAYDGEIKQLTKALDAEYSARAKEYDSEAKQLSKKLDKEYQTLSKELSRQVDAVRKANEQAYNSRKSTLDKQVSELSKSLSKQLAEQKKADSQRIEQARKANDAEVKAFQAATKARIAAIDEEYKAKVKLLEADPRYAELEQRIKELEAETDAEEKALKDRANAEKLAALQSDVLHAGTRRSREDAQKALDDFLLQLEAEKNKEMRSQQIAAARDEQAQIREDIATKKELLKQEYDERKEAVETQRSDELEKLRESNAAEVDALREKLAEQQEAQAEANAARLEQMREHNAAELEQMRESQDAEIEQMREHNAERLEAAKEANSEQLEALKESQSAELAQLKESHQETIAAAREANAEQLALLKESQSEQVQALRDAQQDQIQAMRDSQSDQVQAMRSGAAEQQAVAEKSKSTLLDNANALKSGMEGIASKAREAMFDTAKKLHVGVSKESENTKGDVTTSATNTTLNVVKTYEERKRKVLAYAKEMAQGAKSAHKDTEKDISDPFSKGTSKAVKALSDAVAPTKAAAAKVKKSANDGLSGLDSDYRKTGEKAINRFVDGLLSKNTYNSGQSQAVDARKGMDSVDTYNTGWNFAQGFASGMYGPNLYNVGWEIAVNAYNGMVDALDIHSPSRKTRGVGEYAAQGFLLGMQEFERDVSDQAETFADLVSDGMALDASSLREYESQLRLQEDVFAEHVRRMRDMAQDLQGYMAGMSASAYADLGGLARDMAGYAVSGSKGGVTNINVDVELNNPVVRDQGDVRELVRQIKTEIRREEEMSLCGRRR